MITKDKVKERKQSLENEYYDAVGREPPGEREGGVDLEPSWDTPIEPDSMEIECPVEGCKTLCHNDNGLATHLKAIHAMMPCPYCDGFFKIGRGIKRHVSSSHGEKVDEFDAIHSPILEEMKMEKEVEHKCAFPGCNRSFSTPRGLISHERAHDRALDKKEEKPRKEKTVKKSIDPEVLTPVADEKESFPTEFESFIDNFLSFIQYNKVDVVEFQWKKDGKRRHVNFVYDED